MGILYQVNMKMNCNVPGEGEWSGSNYKGYKPHNYYALLVAYNFFAFLLKLNIERSQIEISINVDTHKWSESSNIHPISNLIP